MWACPALGVGPAGRWVRALGRYLDPAGDTDRYGPRSNPAYGGTKIFGDRPRGLAALLDIPGLEFCWSW